MSEKISLAVDLDDTVLHYCEGLKEFVLENYGRTITGTPSTYSLYQAGWFDSDDDFKKVHGEAVEDGLYEQLRPYCNAIENLWDLSDSGYQINIVTSRFVNPGQHEKVAQDTAASLEKYSIPHSNLLFLHDKTKFIADAYIDDAPHNLINLQKVGRNTIAFDQSYNKGIPGHRAKNWTEVRQILKEQFGQ